MYGAFKEADATFWGLTSTNLWWEENECREEVDGYSGARYKKFSSAAEAEAFVDGYDQPSYRGGSSRSSRGVDVYTDGACFNNGRDDARAGIGVYWGPGHPSNTSEPLSGRQTNNRAEIKAAEKAVGQARDMGYNEVNIKTDSQFLTKSMNDWVPNWKRNDWKTSTGSDVVNRRDFEDLERTSRGMKVNYKYVPGHKGIVGNESADKLATEGAAKHFAKKDPDADSDDSPEDDFKKHHGHGHYFYNESDSDGSDNYSCEYSGENGRQYNDVDSSSESDECATDDGSAANEESYATDSGPVTVDDEYSEHEEYNSVRDNHSECSNDKKLETESEYDERNEDGYEDQYSSDGDQNYDDNERNDDGSEDQYYSDGDQSYDGDERNDDAYGNHDDDDGSECEDGECEDGEGYENESFDNDPDADEVGSDNYDNEYDDSDSYDDY